MSSFVPQAVMRKSLGLLKTICHCHSITWNIQIRFWLTGNQHQGMMDKETVQGWVNFQGWRYTWWGKKIREIEISQQKKSRGGQNLWNASTIQIHQDFDETFFWIKEFLFFLESLPSLSKIWLPAALNVIKNIVWLFWQVLWWPK